MSWAWKNIVLFALMWWFSSKPRPLGQVSAVFLIGYGTFRFLVEFTREPDNFLGLLAGGLSMGQWLSLPMVALGAILFSLTAKRSSVDGDADRHFTGFQGNVRAVAAPPPASLAIAIMRGIGARARSRQARLLGGSPKIQKRWRRPAPGPEGLRASEQLASGSRAARDNEKLMLEIGSCPTADASGGGLEILGLQDYFAPPAPAGDLALAAGIGPDVVITRAHFDALVSRARLTTSSSSALSFLPVAGWSAPPPRQPARYAPCPA